MLIEVLITLAIFSVIMGTVFVFYYNGLKSYSTGSVQVDLQQNARISMDKINNELKWAGVYTIREQGSQIEFYHPGDSKKYTFRQRGRDLEFVIDTAVTKVAYNLYSLNFNTGESGIIHYEITVKDNEHEYTLSSAVKPRNLP